MRISDWSSDVCSSDLASRNSQEKLCIFAQPDGGIEKPPPIQCFHRDDRRGWHGRRIVKKIFRQHIRIAKMKGPHGNELARSEERREGKECVRTWRYRW